MTILTSHRAIAVFMVLALGYFLSSLMRAVTGTLAPTLTKEFGLNAGNLGLLAGAYFFGFAMMQLLLGNWLDRHGPKRVLLGFLSIAVFSCLAFSLANNFWGLLLARLLGGVGVCACLMAPLTGYRSWLDPRTQLRANSWMLMAGSLGLLAATLPVQWALPLFGWRLLFVMLAVLLLVAMLGIAWQLPRWQTMAAPPRPASLRERYAPILQSTYFRRLAPLGLVNYGILLAVQTLWAGPWMMQVAGYSALQAASGLFAINLTMLVIFWLWGTINPVLARAGWTAERIILWGLPFSIAALAGIAAVGVHAGWAALAVYCALSSFLSLSLPAVGMAFPAHEAGRALSAFNLLMFTGAFIWQWGIGVVIDILRAWHWSQAAAHQAAFGILALCCALAYLWFAFVDNNRAASKKSPKKNQADAAV